MASKILRALTTACTYGSESGFKRSSIHSENGLFGSSASMILIEPMTKFRQHDSRRLENG